MPVIVGRLDRRGQPIADLELVGAHHRVTVLIDTGYDGEVFLYHEQLRQAGLEITFTRMDRIQLADGSETPLLVASITVNWLGERRAITLDVAPNPAPRDARGLIGCRLLHDSRLQIDFPQRSVRISRDRRPFQGQGASRR